MTDPERRPDVEVGADPAVWLPGPVVGDDEGARARWVEGAHAALVSDFQLDGSDAAPVREYLRGALTAFSRWDTPANLTYLRIRSVDDRILPVGIELYQGDDFADIADLLPEAFEGITGPAPVATLAERFAEHSLRAPEGTVGETSVEDVEGSDRWQRLLYWLADHDGDVTSRIRHVGWFAEAETLVILRAGGLAAGSTVEALTDLDDLARAVAVEPAGR